MCSMDDVIDRYRSEVIIDGITLGTPIAQARFSDLCNMYIVYLHIILHVYLITKLAGLLFSVYFTNH